MPKPNDLRITFAQVDALLGYDAETGVLIRKVRRGPGKAGSVVGSKQNTGYLTVTVCGVRVQAHRLAWLLQTGSFPDADIDHVNHDRADNRWVNLRAVTAEENRKNKRMYARNKSGHTGVHWHARDNVWTANIRHAGVLIHLGYFKSKEAAVLARVAAQNKHNFHKNHGV